MQLTRAQPHMEHSVLTLYGGISKEEEAHVYISFPHKENN